MQNPELEETQIILLQNEESKNIINSLLSNLGIFDHLRSTPAGGEEEESERLNFFVQTRFERIIQFLRRFEFVRTFRAMSEIAKIYEENREMSSLVKFFGGLWAQELLDRLFRQLGQLEEVFGFGVTEFDIFQRFFRDNFKIFDCGLASEPPCGFSSQQEGNEELGRRFEGLLGRLQS